MKYIIRKTEWNSGTAYAFDPIKTYPVSYLFSSNIYCRKSCNQSKGILYYMYYYIYMYIFTIITSIIIYYYLVLSLLLLLFSFICICICICTCICICIRICICTRIIMMIYEFNSYNILSIYL